MENALKLPNPVQVLDLFPEERAALLDLLSELTPEDWKKPTACSDWSVREVALHILGGDLGNISRRRDKFQGTSTKRRGSENTIVLVNRVNDAWVEGAERLSPRLITDLLAFSGPQLFDYFSSLDLMAQGGSVTWAGLDAAPVWLDVAREYTERWLHQQHIRDAVDKPGLTERRFLAPVLETFAHALPVAFRDTAAPHGTFVHVHFEGEAGGDWALERVDGGWKLYQGIPDAPDALVDVDQSTAWRLFTKGITPKQAERMILFIGNRKLGLHVLRTVAIIA